ncbi:hypothetical protein B0H16DRAFT_1801026 [Mycena metata]|uniref:Uncharacterized protein n=1 Tax=Mycena metata TaxID=1033252 RepID=A0AAD7HBX8_9AGAR|nr:hypothetical protein B0H16DRAFT_1801026 [Mycena metata]
MAYRVLPPDSLPLELWQQIVSHLVDPQRHAHDWIVSQLLPWLAVAPCSLAQNMHDAAFSVIFRRVWWKFYGLGEVNDRVLMFRMLEREQECLLVLRSLKLSAQTSYRGFETEIVPVLVEAFAQFPMLREFDWDKSFGSTPLVVLQTLRTGSPVDLSGFPNLANLEVYDYDSEFLETGTPQIQTPYNLSTSIWSCIRWDLGRHISSYYTFLHTISLMAITPPPDTGLDFTHLPTLANLTLDTIADIQNCGSLPICIRTPHTLRNLELTQVWPTVLGTSVLGGVEIASLDSLSLRGVTLTRGDMDSIFAPQFSDGTGPPAPVAALRSSRPFPALLHLCVSFGDTDLLDPLPSFLAQVNTLQRLELESICHYMQDGEGSFFPWPPSFLLAFRNAQNLRHLSLRIRKLTLDHPIFHGLGDAVQHISSLTLKIEKPWDRQPQAIDDQLKAFSKFMRLQILSIYQCGAAARHPVPFSEAVVEKLAASVPTLRHCLLLEKAWEIQRHAITGEFQRLVAEEVPVRKYR